LEAQIDGSLLLGLTNATTAEMNTISNSIQGSLLYNTTEKNVFQYNGNIWEAVGGSSTNENWILSGNNQYSAVTGNIGIGTTNPDAKLDVNGKARFRDIPVGADTDKLLTTDASGNIRKIDKPRINKSYVQVFKGNKTFGNGNAVLLNLFPEVTIQAGKKVKIDIYVPTRDNTNSWGGLYVNINARVNGTWYNLGNTGYDGGVMNYSATSIHALNHEMLLDFIANLGLPVDQPYTLQFELTARSYNGTTYVNRSHDINRTANNLGNRGVLQSWASDQNYCHIIIEEKDR